MTSTKRSQNNQKSCQEREELLHRTILPSILLSTELNLRKVRNLSFKRNLLKWKRKLLTLSLRTPRTPSTTASKSSSTLIRLRILSPKEASDQDLEMAKSWVEARKVLKSKRRLKRAQGQHREGEEIKLDEKSIRNSNYKIIIKIKNYNNLR